MHHNMAFYLAEKLNIRPNTILDEWGMSEMVVAYGHYINLEAYSNYKDWESRPAESRKGTKAPKKCIVKFRTHDMM